MLLTVYWRNWIIGGPVYQVSTVNVSQLRQPNIHKLYLKAKKILIENKTCYLQKSITVSRIKSYIVLAPHQQLIYIFRVSFQLTKYIKFYYF